MPELMEALDAVVAETKADKARLYITGQSMGGMGTWGTIAEHADKFAAAAPVCGIWQPADASKMNGVAIWAFHGGDDKTVPVAGSRDMIDALKKADGATRWWMCSSPVRMRRAIWKASSGSNNSAMARGGNTPAADQRA